MIARGFSLDPTKLPLGGGTLTGNLTLADGVKIVGNGAAPGPGHCVRLGVDVGATQGDVLYAWEDGQGGGNRVLSLDVDPGGADPPARNMRLRVQSRDGNRYAQVSGQNGLELHDGTITRRLAGGPVDGTNGFTLSSNSTNGGIGEIRSAQVRAFAAETSPIATDAAFEVDTAIVWTAGHHLRLSENGVEKVRFDANHDLVWSNKASTTIVGAGTTTFRSGSTVSSLILGGSTSATQAIRFLGQTTDELVRMGLDGIRVWRDKTGAVGAEAGDTLVDSRGLEWYANYWDGAASQDIVYRARVEALATTPASRWRLDLNGAEVLSVSDEDSGTAVGARITHATLDTVGARSFLIQDQDHEILEIYSNGGSATLGYELRVKPHGNTLVSIGSNGNSASGDGQIKLHDQGGTAGAIWVHAVSTTFAHTGGGGNSGMILSNSQTGNAGAPLAAFIVRATGLSAIGTPAVMNWENSTGEVASVEADGSLKFAGALDHDGTTVGFYGTAPVAQSPAYTPSNVTTVRSYDADVTSLDEVADVLGTLIADLQATGLIG